MKFQDKLILVIGGNSGIGLASAISFAAEGARVVITGRDASTLAAAAETIGPGTLALQSELADLGATDVLIERIRKDYGRIDVLFINAGIGAFVPIEQVTEQTWDRMQGINLKGPYFTIQKALPLMAAGASIILTSSIGHCKGIPGNSVYAAAKAGLRSLARNLGAELVGRGIRVNCISPGPIDTPIINRTEGLAAADVPAMRRMMEDKVPMKRLGTPQEVAAAVVFLASEGAGFITGIDLLVDGGVVSF